MITNPNAKVVLCYGDSNTYGTKPDRITRFEANERWTGLLQKSLGEDYYIIEEGLGGRTTNLGHPNPLKASRNGLEYFRPCLESHLPLDIIVIMLGTNDVKTVYDKSAQDIVDALSSFLTCINELCEQKEMDKPKVVLISPPYMDDKAPDFLSSMQTPGLYDETSIKKTHELAPIIHKLAEETGCAYFDAGPITKVGDDGSHIDLESHKNLAAELKKTILQIS